MYIPGTHQLSSPGGNFIAPDLQAVIDKATIEAETDETSPTAEDWVWLRAERNKRLQMSDKRPVFLDQNEEKAYFQYREALRNLPQTIGNDWSRDTVNWPKWP